jgi:hypothetical protein
MVFFPYILTYKKRGEFDPSFFKLIKATEGSSNE